VIRRGNDFFCVLIFARIISLGVTNLSRMEFSVLLCLCQNESSNVDRNGFSFSERLEVSVDYFDITPCRTPYRK